jgi:uncharacterized protein (AIM24 family)
MLMPGFACGIGVTQKSQIIVGDTALPGAALTGFTALAMINIQGHMFAWITIESAIITLAAVKEKLVIAHSCCVFFGAAYRYNLEFK